jgi:dTDP-glucose 4,6-dehydratase
VDDLVDGIVRLAWSGLAGPVNLGNPEEVSILELAQALIKAAGSASEIVFTARPEDDPQVRRPDISLARRELGWAPRVPLAEGIERTLPWFAQELTAVGQLDPSTPAVEASANGRAPEPTLR